MMRKMKQHFALLLLMLLKTIQYRLPKLMRQSLKMILEVGKKYLRNTMVSQSTKSLTYMWKSFVTISKTTTGDTSDVNNFLNVSINSTDQVNQKMLLKILSNIRFSSRQSLSLTRNWKKRAKIRTTEKRKTKNEDDGETDSNMPVT